MYRALIAQLDRVTISVTVAFLVTIVRTMLQLFTSLSQNHYFRHKKRVRDDEIKESLKKEADIKCHKNCFKK